VWQPWRYGRTSPSLLYPGIEKYVSVDGGLTRDDADSAQGPVATAGGTYCGGTTTGHGNAVIDADDIHVGQTTDGRLSAFHDRYLPLLPGKVTKLPADEKTGAREHRMHFANDLARDAAGRRLEG
jgi:hypothetical protein